MLKGPQGKKRPADVVGAAVEVAGSVWATSRMTLDRARSATAELGRRGGAARARNRTAGQKHEIGKKGAATRWRREADRS